MRVGREDEYKVNKKLMIAVLQFSRWVSRFRKNPEDGDSRFLSNTGNTLQNYTASHLIRQQSS
jgi:hypothetical protein